MLFPISVTHIVYTNENAILNNKLIHCVLDLLIQHSGGRLRLPPGLLQAQVAQRLQVSQSISVTTGCLRNIVVFSTRSPARKRASFPRKDSSPVLARERWQAFENSWKKTQYLMNTLYIHSTHLHISRENKTQKTNDVLSSLPWE